MNLAQITRQAQYQAGLIKQAGTAGSFVSSYELDAWANRGNDILERTLRSIREDWFVKKMTSTDTTAQFLQGVSYTPTALSLTTSAIEYTLPPDLMSIKAIRCVTANYEETKFRLRDRSSGRFGYEHRTESTDTVSPPGEEITVTVYGARTLLLARYLDTALDIEILYTTKTKQLVRYSTGTITATDASTSIAGSGTTWTYLPLDSDFLDMHFGTSASATVPNAEPHYFYDGVYRARVASITDADTLVLSRNKVGALAAGTGYLLASLPQSPEEYHQAIADYVTAQILFKAKSESAKFWFGQFTDTMGAAKGALSRKQSEDIETVEDWNPDAAEY